MKLDLRTAELDVIESDSVITASREANLIMVLTFDDEFKLEVEFEFNETKDDNSASELKFIVDEDKDKIIFDCLNFDNAFGMGTSTPFEMAIYKDKKIFINFWIYTLGEHSARKVEYTIYKER